MQRAADAALFVPASIGLSEQAYENIARDYYARAWGTDDEERAYLRRAIAGETKPGRGQSASWFGQLFKERFRIVVTSGRVAEIKLRCQKRYVFFRHREGVTYKIDPAGGICGIEVTGDPETRFELIQS